MPLEIVAGSEPPPIIVSLTSRVTELAGLLVDEARRPAPAFTVVAFSTDRQYWTTQSRRIQIARPASDGQFSLKNLPAGAYRLVAVTDIEDGQWRDPKFLASLAGSGIEVTITDGQRTVQNLRIAK